MSQEKAQLIAPLGHFAVPGLNVSGVVTASSFSGNCTGTASSIAQGTNVVVGVMTASSFAEMYLVMLLVYLPLQQV